MKKKAFNTNTIFGAFFLLFAVGLFIFYAVQGNVKCMIYSALMPLFLLIPPLAYKLFRLNPVKELALSIYILCFFAFGLGVACEWYQITEWYDKFIHFVTGYYFTIIGLGIFYYLKTDNAIEWKKDRKLVLWFSAATSLMIAVGWEVFEFLDFLITGHDAQHHLTTGVFDTMGDLVACVIGTIIAVVVIYLYYKKRKYGPLIKTFEAFYNANILKEEETEALNSVQ